MEFRSFVRKAFQYFSIDIHRIYRDDSPFIDPAQAMIASVLHNGKRSRFLVADTFDVIQKHHADGKFYEQDLLDVLAENIKEGACFVDIGANVGNHSIFAAVHLGASRVIAFEPMRLQHAILSINVLLNELQEKVEIHKLALSDRSEFARMITPNAHNIGRSMISAGVYGEWVKLVRGDDLLSAAQVDFIKIDVEGHEMEALAGLAGTIDRCRPAMLIEVSDVNGTDFENWLMDNNYSVSWRMRHHGENTEVLALPG